VNDSVRRTAARPGRTRSAESLDPMSFVPGTRSPKVVEQEGHPPSLSRRTKRPGRSLETGPEETTCSACLEETDAPGLDYRIVLRCTLSTPES
jgi:hypothetical protein